MRPLTSSAARRARCGLAHARPATGWSRSTSPTLLKVPEPARAHLRAVLHHARQGALVRVSLVARQIVEAHAGRIDLGASGRRALSASLPEVRDDAREPAEAAHPGGRRTRSAGWRRWSMALPARDTSETRQRRRGCVTHEGTGAARRRGHRSAYARHGRHRAVAPPAREAPRAAGWILITAHGSVPSAVVAADARGRVPTT